MTASNLPQLGGDIFLTDSGLETDLVFNHGVDLPEFASFPLLTSDAGLERLHRYFTAHADLAASVDAGFVLEAATWRANADWGALLGYDAQALHQVNRLAIELLDGIRADHADSVGPFVISGCLGPRGDAYRPDEHMSAGEAAAYHRPQIETFAGTSADMVNAMTLTYAAEAEGIASAARDVGLPVALSFTVETDGRLPDGSTLAQAVQAVDDATEGYPAYYALNCAHPSHLAGVLDPDAAWTLRVRGLRANASRLSHAELDEATELDDGDPATLGAEYAELRSQFPGLTVLGGCCGTDLRHIESVAAACLPA